MEPLGFKQRKVLNKEPLSRELQNDFIEPMLTLMHIYNGVNLDYKYETSTALKTKTKEMLCDVIMDNYINEISDPNNIKETNQFLKESEERKDLPSNVKLCKPTPGFCIKSEKYNIKLWKITYKFNRNR